MPLGMNIFFTIYLGFGYFLAPKDKQKRRENKFISINVIISRSYCQSWEEENET